MAVTYGAPTSKGIQVGWVRDGPPVFGASFASWLRGFAPEVVPELVHGDETIEPVDAAVEVQVCGGRCEGAKGAAGLDEDDRR